MRHPIKLFAAALILAIVSALPGFGEIRGRALVTDAPSRVAPGDLYMITLGDGQPRQKLEITKVTYGNVESNKLVDVTAKIRELVTEDGLTTQLKPQLFGPDPAPNQIKKFLIEYTLDGQAMRQTLESNQFADINLTRRTELLVKGAVIDAHFSPDGKQIVYGMDGRIYTLELASRKSTDLGECTTELTYFTWGDNNLIYWSDGPKLSEIWSVNAVTKERKLVHKGREQRATVSNDGKRFAWVLPPMAAIAGGKQQYRFTGGCGGAVSPSGKYLTSNLTTTHQLLGIYAFNEDGPSEQPIMVAKSLNKLAINGFSFGRSDNWALYSVEGPRWAAPAAYICNWETDEHLEVARWRIIKDFIDDSEALPAGATLESIAICRDSPFNVPMESAPVSAGQTLPVKVVGVYKHNGATYTPRLAKGVTWKLEAAKAQAAGGGLLGVAESGTSSATASFQGKSASTELVHWPRLTGDGFKGEYFANDTFTDPALTRVDPFLNFEWHGSTSPDEKIDGRRRWGARWTGEVAIPQDGEFVFGVQVGEGNDGTIKGEGDTRVLKTNIWINDEPVKWTRTGGYPWIDPRRCEPITLKRGRAKIRVETIDTSAHPVIMRLSWQGPGFGMQPLGGGFVHSGAK